jgi:hypothetical protein
MNIKIVMMCKNESDLLMPWARYHGTLFGYENIIVIDNGSDESVSVSLLKEIEELGVAVLRQYFKKEDYCRKGDITAEIIKELESTSPADFYFPLDCDEFIGARIDGNVSFSRDSIFQALEPYLDDQRVLMIDLAYDNHGILPGYFLPSWGQMKCFFAHGACGVLDHGSHVAQSRTGSERVKTPIIYMHYHYKPYDIIVAHAINKLRPFVKGFDENDLDSIPYGVPGTHLIGHLRHPNAESYYNQFGIDNYVRIPQFGQALFEVGTHLPFSDQCPVPAGFDPEAYLEFNQDVQAIGVDPAFHYARQGYKEGRKWY